MLKARIFNSNCYIIMMFSLTSYTNMKTEAFPNAHLVVNNVNQSTPNLNNDDKNDIKQSFFKYSPQNNSTWIVPYYNFSYNNNITFCGNQQLIRVPVNKESDITIIPCYTNYAGISPNGTDILLYKGSPETHLTPISGNEMYQHKILEYISDSGFRYNFSGDWSENGSGTLERWRYTCFIANSNAENYIIVEIYRDDNSAIVKSKDCDPVYHVNNTGMFSCQIPGNINATDFEWSYRTKDGNDIVFYPKGRTKKTNSGTVIENISIKLPHSSITGIVCRANKSDSNSIFQGIQDIYIKDIEIPIVLENGTVELDDEPGLQLNCSFIADDTQSTHVFWLQDGRKLDNPSVKIIWSMPIRKTTLNGLASTYTSTNYTCVVKNRLGSSSKSFIVARKKPNPHPVYLYVLASLVPVFVLGFVITCVEWKRRKNTVMAYYKTILNELKENDPRNSSSINFVKDSKKWESLSKGVYGEVWKTEFTCPNTGEKKPVVLKTFTWPPFLSIKDAKQRFDDLINEIRICQELSGCSNIVCYEGFYAPNVHGFNVYLILDYCYPGQLEEFIYQHRQDHTFIGDIDLVDRARMQPLDNNDNLKTSHLMKWAQQIAEAMTILHEKNILHRDLALRNILLKKLGMSNSESINDVHAQLADFGMSRFLKTCSDSYIIQEDMPKERHLPVLWYPPESIGFDSSVKYTKKSDVWSFGVLLWEMFSRGSHPKFSYGFTDEIKADNVQQELQNGRRLGREYLYNAPEEIWSLMESCWSLIPEDRPDFCGISQRLRDINTSYGLYDQEVVIRAEDLNPEGFIQEDLNHEDLNHEDLNYEDLNHEDLNNEDLDREDFHREDLNQEGSAVYDNIKGIRTKRITGKSDQCACAVDEIELSNLDVPGASSTKLTNLEAKLKYEDAGKASSHQQRQSVPDQLMQNSGMVRSNLAKKDVKIQPSYMHHGFQETEE